MKILVDADACPVKDIIVSVAKEYKIPVIMFIDTTHILDDDYSKIVICDKGFNSADIVLINKAEKGDIIVTQDFGVATMALARGAYALNQNGLIFSNNNMDRLLFERHISQKVRRAGGKTSNPKKRTKENDKHFETSLRRLIAYTISSEN